jgi:hypothetical protein
VTVAALYVDPNGAYANLPGVEVWDEARDARTYYGPWPVVAHPPCNKWSPLAYINQRRIPGYLLGDDAGCFAAALDAVRRFGGVLEHPAESRAWPAHQLARPRSGCWSLSYDEWHGRVTEVEQGVYGHRARKRTWLYAITPARLPALDWSRATGDAIVSGFTHQPMGEHVACEHRRVRPAEANATPPAFRDVLLGVARSALRDLEALALGEVRR